MSEVLVQFDDWIRDESDVAALVLLQWLVPVEGRQAVIFPPTYTLQDTEVGRRFEDGEPVPGVYKGQKGPMGYNLDVLSDGRSVCQIDSVGSQANRMEVIFMREQYKNLVPQVTIMAGEHEINLLQAGHRAADAIVRFSDLYQDLREAFEAVRRGDATKLAKIAPTSIVFGVWDSRDTQVKLPRIVRSVIRAFGVKPLHRSAQYIPCVDYVSSGLLEEPRNKEEQDAMSELGLNHVPAPWSHGGIVVEGEIRRDATLNLAALRGLSAVPKDESLQLRRYILGLSLVAFTAPQETFLREGCQLVPDLDRPPEWFVVRHDGRRERISNFTHEQAFEYAKEAATSFGVGEDRSATFNVEAARNAQSKPKEERKRSRRSR